MADNESNTDNIPSSEGTETVEISTTTELAGTETPESSSSSSSSADSSNEDTNETKENEITESSSSQPTESVSTEELAKNVDTVAINAPVDTPSYEEQIPVDTEGQHHPQSVDYDSSSSSSMVHNNNEVVTYETHSSILTNDNYSQPSRFRDIQLSDGDVITVQIENENYKKPYMGGLRNTKTGLIYHHTYTQTPVERKSKWANAPQRYNREVQVAPTVTRSQQIKRECSAQTDRKDLHHDKTTDRTVVVKPYFTADELHKVKVQNAIRIQCQWRGALARKRAYQQRLALYAAEQAARDAANQAAENERRKLQKDIERRMHPKTAEDFAILYDEVEAWRVHETNRIHAETVNDEKGRKAAMSSMLAKESALVATIERLRLVADKENKDAKVSNLLSSIAAPLTWQTSNGETVSVVTPLASRAAELKALYDSLVSTGSGVVTPSEGSGTLQQQRDTRLDLLLNIKYTVKEFDGALIKEIVTLIDREADMLGRGRPNSSLEGLRARLKNLFQIFISDPKYNPGASSFNKQPISSRDPRTLPSFLQPTAKRH